MNLSEISLHFPQSLADAFKLLGKLDDSRILAGGTDLLVDMKQGLTSTTHLISLQKIKKLKGIEEKSHQLRIGSMVTLREIISNSLINQHIPILADVARSMASSQIRSVATVGGNIASAVPSADLPPALIAAEASVQLDCLESSRKALLHEFFTGPRISICREEELLTAIIIPIPLPGTGIAYQKLTLREANALAVASVASSLTLKDGIIDRANIVFGAVAPVPFLAVKASDSLCGHKPSESLFGRAAAIAKKEAQPISDIRGSIWYRKELIHTLTVRTLTEALSQAQGKLKQRK